VWCAFVFDRDILDPLPRADRRVEFIRDSLVGVDAELRALGAATASTARACWCATAGA
jgi:deoxyribodipyrimidine photo-lyase